MPTKINPVWYVVAIPLAGILIAAAIVVWRKSGLENGDRFVAQTYCSQPENYMGNAYVFDAQIDAQLAWSPDVGRILAVKLADGRRVPVFVDKSIRENLMAGQRYRMDTTVGRDGAICVVDIEKL